MDGRNEKGRFVPGHGFSNLPPKPGKRKRGQPRKGEETRIGTKFIEDVVLKKYKTAIGAVMEIDALLPRMPEAEQAKLHLRILELYTKVLPRELKVDQGLTINMVVDGVQLKPTTPYSYCPDCHCSRCRGTQAIDVSPASVRVLPREAHSLPDPVSDSRNRVPPPSRRQGIPEPSEDRTEAESFTARWKRELHQQTVQSEKNLLALNEARALRGEEPLGTLPADFTAGSPVDLTKNF